jgi:soluble lytic murein transglycosylase
MTVSRTTLPLLALLLLVPRPESAGSLQDQLSTTTHQALPSTAGDLWLVPSASETRAAAVYKPLVDGAAAFADGDYAKALPLVSRASLASTELRGYADYYAAAAQLRLSKAAEARKLFHAIRERKPGGALAVKTALGEAEAAEALGDYPGALDIYEDLAAGRNTVNQDILSRVGRVALASGDRKKAAEAYLRVYYEFPLTDAAAAAETALADLKDNLVRVGYKADLGRAQVLYGARRYNDARAAFAAIQSLVSGDDRELVGLRIAECDFFLERYAAARTELQPYLATAARKAEARFFDLSALRELGENDRFVEATRALVQEFPDSSWSEEALNNLGTHYILTNEDELAAETFGELYAKFPQGERAERAAWKYGWFKYKTGSYAETIRVFEGAAATFRRSNYRPSYLYWAARSQAKLGNGAEAAERFRLVHADYGNSYYGRLADVHLTSAEGTSRADVLPVTSQTLAPDAPTIPTEHVIRLLLAAGLLDDALAELQFAQRAWGPSTPVDATIAWVYNRKGDLRRGITLMRRAYPQHMTAWGQELPPEILEVIFPLTYWDQIRKQSAARNLDPYVVAALIAQESTFDPKIRSAANAWGLMQIVPATGRRLARSVGIRRFTTSMLTNADTNIRLGTLYFSRLVEQFGGVHYALASYNAGENRIVRWRAERPGLDQDEFIDDIPFPETQNYVKRILGTAEDYRMLYGKMGGRPIPVDGSDRGPAAAPAAAAKPAPAAATRKPAAAAATRKPAAKKAAPKKATAKPAARKPTTKKPAAKKPTAKKRPSK